MAMVLTEEQVQLQDSARKFLQDVAPVSALRKLRDENDPEGYSAGLWKQMTELGYPGILIDEQYGGLGLGPTWMGLVMEEAGRCLTASPLMSTAILGASLLQAAGNEEQKSSLLPTIAAGELITALAVDEGPHHDPCSINTIASPEGDDYLINGNKTFVLDGHVADKIIVAARTSGEGETGITLFIVDGNAEGITRQKRCMVDSRNICDVTFSNARASKAAVLGDPGEGYAPLRNTLDMANALLAAEMLGGSLEAFERTLAYLKTREQFDVIIGSFQALKHRAALMFCEIELAKSVVREALTAQEENRDDAGRLASLAKIQLNDTYKLVSNEGIQMFGGIGMTDEEEIGFFIKRARVAAQTFGNTRYHLDQYASAKGY